MEKKQYVYSTQYLADQSNYSSLPNRRTGLNNRTGRTLGRKLINILGGINVLVFFPYSGHYITVDRKSQKKCIAGLILI